MALLRVVRVFLLLAWPATLFAAQSLQSAITGVGWVTWLMLAVLSTLSGVTALFWRLADMFKDPARPVPAHLHFVIAAQMLSSWLAGILAFVLSMHFEVPEWWMCACIIGASFAGSRFIDKVSERLFPQLDQQPKQ